MVEVKELTFLDLAVLERIDGESVVERFGPKINASLFGAANVLGTLKIKGYLDIQTSLGLSPIILTESGKQVLRLADEKSKGDVDALDAAVLSHIGLGFKDPFKLEQELNVRSGDLAFRLYKLSKMGLIDYTIKSGTGASPSPRIEVMLTEQGFAQTEQARGYAKTIAKVKEAREDEEAEKVRKKVGEEEHENIAEELVSDEPVVTPAGRKTEEAGEKEALPERIHATPEEVLEPPQPVQAAPKEEPEEPVELGEEQLKAPARKQAPGPVKIDAKMKMQARMQYYFQRYWKHAVIVALIILVALAYAAYRFSGF